MESCLLSDAEIEGKIKLWSYPYREINNPEMSLYVSRDRLLITRQYAGAMGPLFELMTTCYSRGLKITSIPIGVSAPENSVTF